jgi:hypothetical protein
MTRAGALTCANVTAFLEKAFGEPATPIIPGHFQRNQTVYQYD